MTQNHYLSFCFGKPNPSSRWVQLGFKGEVHFKIWAQIPKEWCWDLMGNVRSSGPKQWQKRTGSNPSSLSGCLKLELERTEEELFEGQECLLALLWSAHGKFKSELSGELLDQLYLNSHSHSTACWCEQGSSVLIQVETQATKKWQRAELHSVPQLIPHISHHCCSQIPPPLSLATNKNWCSALS